MMHGKLDEGAAFALDELLAMAQEHDADIDACQMDEPCDTALSCGLHGRRGD